MRRSHKSNSIFVLLLSNFLNVFGWALVTPLYALYATELGASPQVVTFSWSFYTLLAGVLMIALGWLEDRLSKKERLLTGGYIIQTLGASVLFFALDVRGLVIGLGVYAIGTGIVMPIWKLLYARKEHRGKEATEWGVFHGVNTLLVSAAAAISGIVLTTFGFKGILGLMVAAHALAAVASMRNGDMAETQRGFAHILFILIAAGVVLAVGVTIFVTQKSHTSLVDLVRSGFGLSAEKVGRDLAGGSCTGTGPVTLSALPMKFEDVSSIIPYGLMVNQHVTPIDHQYFAPLSYDSPRDSYDVRAPADGHITQIQHRTSDFSNFSHGQKTDEYRVVIDYTCTFLSYFDLITSLSPDIQPQIGTQQNANVDIPVKAGQVIGKIGGQTLDFAVWDTTKSLSGFLVPDHYRGEPWKIYTADPLDYASPALKASMMSLNPRKTQPLSGKIDYDIDGKLAGNWFLKGQGGYTGNDSSNHDNWKGHFAVAPNNYDPSLWEISSGVWGENGDQFAIDPSGPNPAAVGVLDGLIRYNLFRYQLFADGKVFEGKQTIHGNQNITAKAGGGPVGCMLVQLSAERELKAEGFPGQSCARLGGFDGNVTVYER